jgi:hypothetical protein
VRNLVIVALAATSLLAAASAVNAQYLYHLPGQLLSHEMAPPVIYLAPIFIPAF